MTSVKSKLFIAFLCGFFTSTIIAAGLIFGPGKTFADNVWNIGSGGGGLTRGGDSYACIRQALKARGMSGNIPKPSFKITYTVPGCYRSAGYSVSKVYMRGSEVAVRYQK